MDEEEEEEGDARGNARHALELRVVHHKYAAQIAVHARAVERHTRKLVRIHARIKAEAVAIAGADYDERHTVGFEGTASLRVDEQLRDTDSGGEVFGTGLVDVVDTASSMANSTGKVAACSVPHPLLSK
jgi:hypothetical protein